VGRGRDRGEKDGVGPRPRPDPARTDDPRICAGCGRAFGWRPALARSWDAVRWCSDACRRRGLRPVDLALESAILELLETRPNGGTICPSEAVRKVSDDGGADDRGDLMEPARRAARRLVATGAVEILQDGRVVDPSTAKGPIRIRRARSVG